MAANAMTPEGMEAQRQALAAHVRASDAGPVQVVQAHLQDLVALALAEATRLEAPELHARVAALKPVLADPMWARLTQWKSTAEVLRRQVIEAELLLGNGALIRTYVGEVARVTPEALRLASTRAGGWGVAQRQKIEALLGSATAAAALLTRTEEGTALLLQRAMGSGVSPVAGPAPAASTPPRQEYAASATREP